MSDETLTGHDLRVRRVTADVRIKELADVMGVPPSSVSRLENSRRVTDRMRERYVTALATFPTSQTTPDGQSAA